MTLRPLVCGQRPPTIEMLPKLSPGSSPDGEACGEPNPNPLSGLSQPRYNYQYKTRSSKDSRLTWALREESRSNFIYPSLSMSIDRHSPSPSSPSESSSAPSSPSSPIKWELRSDDEAVEEDEEVGVQCMKKEADPFDLGEVLIRKEMKSKFEEEERQRRIVEFTKIRNAGRITLMNNAIVQPEEMFSSQTLSSPPSSPQDPRKLRRAFLDQKPLQLVESGEELFVKLMKRKARLTAVRSIMGDKVSAVSNNTDVESEYLRQRRVLSELLARLKSSSGAEPLASNELADGILCYRVLNADHSAELVDDGEQAKEEEEDEDEEENAQKQKQPQQQQQEKLPRTNLSSPAAHNTRLGSLDAIIGDATAASSFIAQQTSSSPVADLALARVALRSPGGSLLLPSRGGSGSGGDEQQRGGSAVPYLATRREKQLAADSLSLAQLRVGLAPESFINRARPTEKRRAAPFPSSSSSSSSSTISTGSSASTTAMREDNNTLVLDLLDFGIGDEHGACLGQSLNELPSLHKLLLRGNRLSLKSVAVIAKNVSCTSLAHLDLSSNNLAGASQPLAALFRRHNVIQHLNVSDCRLGDAEFADLCGAFAFGYAACTVYPSLATFAHFSRNTFAEAADHLKQAEQQQEGVVAPRMRLRELIAAKNEIGTKGVAALADFLCNQNAPMTIKTVNLSWNLINSKAAELLADAVNRNPFIHLTALDLSCNSITEAGGQALGCMLYSTARLESLLLSQNQISSRACFVFSKSLKGHPSMKVLDLSQNALGEAGARALFRTILGGLRCFVMMRACSYSLVDKIFDHRNPSLDSPYTLSMASPYDAAVLQNLISLAEDDPSHCRFVSVAHDGRPLQVSVSHGEAWLATAGGGKERWHPPSTGTLVVGFAFVMAPPTLETRAPDAAVKLVHLIVNGGRTEADRKNWLRLLCADLSCTTAQAQAMINFFVEKGVIGLGGLTRTDCIAAMWANLVDTENMFDLLFKNLDAAARQKVLYMMTFELFKFNWVNPSGYWRLNLANPAHRETCLRIIAINEQESSFGRLQSGRGDTSQHGDWNNFRNIHYFSGVEEKSSGKGGGGEGGEEDDDNTDNNNNNDDDDDEEEEPFLMTRAFIDKLPFSGMLSFDYVSTRRPFMDAPPEDKDSEDNDDDESSLSQSSSPRSPLLSPRSPSQSPRSLQASESEASVGLKFFADQGSTSTGSATTATGSQGPSLGQRGVSIVTDDEMTLLLSQLGLSLRVRCVPPQTMFVLLFLQFASVKYYFTTQQVCVLLDCFGLDDALQARVLTVLFSRIWDLHNFDRIMRHLPSRKAQQEALSRLGYLNVMNPLKPAMDYAIDLRYLDNRAMLVFLLQTAPTEVSDQIREDPDTEVACNTMYGSLNRVLTTVRAEVMRFNYGEVGERTLSNNVSWNLRRDALPQFLVGTKPLPKGLFDVIRFYQKMAAENELSIGPLELQYEAYLKKKAKKTR